MPEVKTIPIYVKTTRKLKPSEFVVTIETNLSKSQKVYELPEDYICPTTIKKYMGVGGLGIQAETDLFARTRLFWWIESIVDGVIKGELDVH